MSKMDSEEQGLSAPGAALLLIIGEPFSEDNKTQILAEISKGFRCWDVEDTGININEELAQIANKAALGEEGVSGDRFIHHQSDNLDVEILINPLTQAVKNGVKKLLVAPAPVKYIIYAGHAFQDTGAWVLQDDTFSFSSLAQVFKNAEVESALKQNIEASLTIHTLADSNWGQAISKADFTKNLRIQLNPPEKLENNHGVLQFTAYVGSFVKVVPVTSLLQASEQFGNISFTRPTLYIFPGCQGDSALFGINGFNLLVDAGYNRRACFWDFARHLDRVDAMLLSHLGTDNIFSINTVLQRKSMENIHPQIGYLYFNAPEKMVQAPIDESGDGPSETNPSLLVNLSAEAKKLTTMAKQLGISPHPCSRSATAPGAEPINLYHKLGHGSLDMYPLNPVSDCKEMKEFYQNWTKQSASMGSSGPFPLQNATSACTLIVWKPYNNSEKIVRILFPGNAPQHKIAEGLEKMKEFRFLKFASCTGKDLIKPPPTKKASTRPASGASSGRSTTTRTTASSRTERLNTTRTETSRRTTDTKTSTRSDTRSTLSSPTKSSRPAREEPKKSARSTTTKEDSKTQPTSARARSTTSPAKTTAAKKSPSPKSGSPAKSPSPPKISSPAKSPSPPKTSPAKSAPSPKSGSPAKSASKSPSKSPSPEKVIPPKDVPATKTASIDSSPLNEVPAAVPEPPINHLNSQGDAKPPETELIDLGPGDSASNSSSHHEVSPPKEAWSSSPQPSSDIPQSINSSGDALFSNNKAQDGTSGISMENGGQQGISNGFEHSRYDHSEADDEEIHPQALPEPPSVHVESPSQESDGMPDYSAKMEADEQELFDFSEAEAEADFGSTDQGYNDPAELIPPSPEPSQEEPTSYSFPTSTSETQPSSFIFDNDDPETSAVGQNHQMIHYGVDHTKGRAMGGIQEEDEEDAEDNDCGGSDKDALTADETFNKEDNNKEDETAFERDDFEDEEIQKSVTSSTTSREEGEDEQSVKSDCRLSAERQFEDFEDEQTHNGKEATQIEDVDKDVDELQTAGVNGGINGSQEHAAQEVSGCLMQNKFETPSPNTLINLDGHGECDPKSSPESHPFDVDSDEELRHQPFDPSSQWGQPMGLPSPPPLSESRRGATSPQKSRATDKRPASSSTRMSADSKTRGTAAKPSSARAGTGARRPGSSRSSPQTSKVPPLPPMTAFYVDLTYIPNHGDPAYCDAEFFKRVRARYYVLSSLSPNPKVLDCLMEAKGTWEDKDLEVTLIPTYDNETLRHWMGLNKEKLQELHIDMTPAVSRCTIQLQDLETSLPAYRLEV